MKNMLSVTRLSPADAIAVNEKVQVAVRDAVSTHNEAVVSSPVIDAATRLNTTTSALEQTKVEQRIFPPGLDAQEQGQRRQGSQEKRQAVRGVHVRAPGKKQTDADGA